MDFNRLNLWLNETNGRGCNDDFFPRLIWKPQVVTAAKAGGFVIIRFTVTKNPCVIIVESSLCRRQSESVSNKLNYVYIYTYMDVQFAEFYQSWLLTFESSWKFSKDVFLKLDTFYQRNLCQIFSYSDDGPITYENFDK